MDKEYKMRKLNNSFGFTLGELIVVLALITTISTFVVVSSLQHRKVARDNKRIADIQTIRTALEEYRAQCGEYPEKIDLKSNNGCVDGVSLGDFLPDIPKNAAYADQADEPVAYKKSYISDENSYLYAGLSTNKGGKCYDYHLGAKLEGKSSSKNLSVDHDAGIGAGDYTETCRNSNPDFDGDDYNLIYDLRSRSIPNSPAMLDGGGDSGAEGGRSGGSGNFQTCSECLANCKSVCGKDQDCLASCKCGPFC